MESKGPRVTHVCSKRLVLDGYHGVLGRFHQFFRSLFHGYSSKLQQQNRIQSTSSQFHPATHLKSSVALGPWVGLHLTSQEKLCRVCRDGFGCRDQLVLIRISHDNLVGCVAQVARCRGDQFGLETEASVSLLPTLFSGAEKCVGNSPQKPIPPTTGCLRRAASFPDGLCQQRPAPAVLPGLIGREPAWRWQCSWQPPGSASRMATRSWHASQTITKTRQVKLSGRTGS